MTHPLVGIEWSDELCPVDKDKVLIDPDNPTLLFVYGSLKKGYKHHAMLGKDSDFVGYVETEPHYLLYDTGPYPGMIQVQDGEGRAIEGELYRVKPAQMLKLDARVPHQFKKKEVKIQGMTDKIITHVWDYSVDKFLDCGTSWPRE